jgi:hypothetical protein
MPHFLTPTTGQKRRLQTTRAVTPVTMDYINEGVTDIELQLIS